MEFSNDDKWLSDNEEEEEEDQGGGDESMEGGAGENDETEQMDLNPVSVRQRIDVIEISLLL